MKPVQHSLLSVGWVAIGLLLILNLLGCAHTQVIPLLNREIVALTADDVVRVMRGAGFSDKQIFDLGTDVRNQLATSGAAEIRVGNKVEAILAVRGHYIHVSSRHRGSFMYDLGTDKGESDTLKAFISGPPNTQPPPVVEEMVLIPAGSFQMGDPFNEGQDDERPAHTVTVDELWMDKHEVSNALFCEFLNERGNQTEGGVTWLSIEDKDCLIERREGPFVPKRGYENYPVIEVTWHGARAYAEWAGKRLPTEEEWEKAARGGLAGKQYPWGDNISNNEANYSGTDGRDIWDGTSPVGSFPPNGYGLYDVAGNVWEWCADWYDSGYYSKNQSSKPTGSATGTSRVVRGGSWNNLPHSLGCASRLDLTPEVTDHDIGFRCVR